MKKAPSALIKKSTYIRREDDTPLRASAKSMGWSVSELIRHLVYQHCRGRAPVVIETPKQKEVPGAGLEG